MPRGLGCGAVMLVAVYSITQSAIGSVLVTATLRVCKGSPTSCLLFIIYVDDLIKMIKDGMRVDGFFIAAT